MSRWGAPTTFLQLVLAHALGLLAGFSVVLVAVFVPGCGEASIGDSRSSEVCTPDCVNKQCGDDGCDGSCGECAGGGLCNGFGACYDPDNCTPDCTDRECGPDGCGGSCGDCAGGELCNGFGACYDPNSCTPDCADRVCGLDGCGGSCGECTAGELCNGLGTCYDPTIEPAACVPNCNGRVCGSDGCSGACGSSPCPSGQFCDTAGQCTTADGIAVNFEFNDAGQSSNSYTCASPCLVLFDAVEKPTDAEYPISSHPNSQIDPFVDMFYHWDFGDPQSGYWVTTGKPKNRFSGPLGAHVYEIEEGAGDKSFVVTLIAQGPDGTVGQKQKTITVTDPAVTWKGKTVCISRTASETDWSGCPAGAQRIDGQTGQWNAVIKAQLDAGKRRVLLKRAQKWTANDGISLDRDGPGMIGAFGSGARPEVVASTGGRKIVKIGDEGDWRFTDHLLAGAGDSGIGAFGRANGKMAKRFLALRVDAKAGTINSFVSFAASGLTAAQDVASDIGFVESNWLRAGIDGDSCNFIAARRLTIMGSKWQECLGEHVIRIQFGDTVLINNNILEDAPMSKALVGIRDIENCETNKTFACREDTVNLVLSDNYFGSGGVNFVRRAGGGVPPPGKYRGSHGVAERNFCYRTAKAAASPASFAQSRKCISAGGETPHDFHHAAVRNNIALMNRDWEMYRAFTIDGDHITASNNTCYTPNALGGSTLVQCVRVYSEATSVTVTNNVLYAPNAEDKVVVNDETAMAQKDGNLLASSNPFVVQQPSQPADFKPGPESPLLDSGAAEPLRLLDLYYQSAPADCDGDGQAQHNIGAWECVAP